MASPTVQVNVRMAPDLYEKVRAIAARNNKTASAAITEALETYVSTQTNGSAASSSGKRDRAVTTKG